MESKPLLKVTELLSVQQIKIHEINNNTANFITVKETGKNKKTKLNHQQDQEILLKNSFEILLMEECQDKLEATNEDNSMLPSFYQTFSKRRQKRQSTKHNKQPEADITDQQYEKPFEQRKARTVAGRRTYPVAINFGKKICAIGDSHLNRTKKNNFQKSVNGWKTCFNAFWGGTSKRLNRYILPTLHENQPDVVLLHIHSNDLNNQTKTEINTEKLAGDIVNIGKFCIDLGVKEVAVSSILPEKNTALR